MQCKDCEYNKETNLFHTEKYCMRLGAICGLLGCGEGIPKVKTNADRIRAMSDEELAEFLHWGHCPNPEYFNNCKYVGSEELPDCKGCWIDWLGKEIKEQGESKGM